MHKSVPVRDVLADRGMGCSRLCPVCKNQIESIDHLLRECVFARAFWSKMGVLHLFTNIHAQSFDDWLYENCLSSEFSRTIFLGVLFFLLQFGICGSIETKLFLKIFPLI